VHAPASSAREWGLPDRHPSRRVLLVEDLDAIGADVGDAKRRASRIQAAGHEVAWVAVAAPGDAAIEDAGRPAAALVSREGAGPRLAAMAADSSAVILASAWSGGGPLTRWLPRDARWWPTGWACDSRPPGLGWVGGWMRGGHRLEPLDGALAREAPWLLGWAEVDPPESLRPRLPLWDGELVLAPSGLEGPSGSEIIAAFARLTEDWSGIDLVAWSHPSAELERRTRASGIDLRVHSVGPAPRRAESSWLVQASVVVIDARARLSTGFLLRVLAAGCPLLWVGREGRASGIARWLAEQGCARVVDSEATAIAAALDVLVQRDADVEASIERGRRLAARHDSGSLADRLHPLLAPFSGTRRAA
jgi:hypothetical protein